MEKTFPQSEEEFEALMDSVDRRLVMDGFSIGQRPLNAIMAIGREYQATLPVTEPVPGYEADPVFRNWPFVQRILRWYDLRYGDRLKVDFSPGRLVVLLRGDPWVMRLPRIYGKVAFVASRTPKDKARPAFSMGQDPIVHNVLDGIVDLPQGFRDVLTDEELRELLNWAILSFTALTGLEQASQNELISNARSDYLAAVDYIVAKNPSYGQAKWASLQAVEKLLKAVLLGKGEKSIKRDHNLAGHLKEVERAGVVLQVDELISTIQCRPGIRYGEESATLLDAVAAHHATLKVILQLNGFLPQRHAASVG